MAAAGSAVSKLHIALTASAAAMKRPFDSAFRMVASFVERSRASLRGFGANLFQGIAQGIGQQLASRLSSVVGPQMQVIDGLAKQADLIGIATEKLAAYRHAATLGGLSAEQMDKALRDMSRRVAEAAHGSGDAAAVLERLGLNARELATLTADQQLKTIADALDGIATEGDRALVAAKLFGDEAQMMSTILRGGSAALEAAEQEANRLGLALSRTDASKVEAANDAIARMQAVWSGVTAQLAVGLAPLITAIGNSFLDFGASGANAGGAIGAAFEIVGRVIARIADITNGVIAVFQFLQASVNRLLQYITAGIARIDAATGDRLFGGSVAAFRDEFERTADDLFASSSDRMSDALAGTAGEAFLEKLREAHRQAESVGDAAADRLSQIEVPIGARIAEEIEKAATSAVDRTQQIEPTERPDRQDRDLSVGALQRGTAEAFTAANQARRANEELQLARTQLRAQQDANRLLFRVAKVLEANATAPSAL